MLYASEKIRYGKLIIKEESGIVCKILGPRKTAISYKEIRKSKNAHNSDEDASNFVSSWGGLLIIG